METAFIYMSVSVTPVEPAALVMPLRAAWSRVSEQACEGKQVK